MFLRVLPCETYKNTDKCLVSRVVHSLQLWNATLAEIYSIAKEENSSLENICGQPLAALFGQVHSPSIVAQSPVWALTQQQK